MAMDTGPDMILLTETWCNGEVSDAFLTIPGYTLCHRMDREDTAGGRGGGLLIYAKIGLSVLVLDKTVPFNQYCKFLVSDVIVYLIYRPPSGGQTSLDNLTELVQKAEKNSILIGDFNLPEVDWSTWTTAHRSRALLDAAEECGMEQLVSFSTHNKGNILDLVLTNIPERILDVSEAGRLGHSDHTAVEVRVAVRGGGGGGGGRNQQPDWNRANWAEIRKELGQIDWNQRLYGKDTEDAWCFLRDSINEAVNRHVPPRRQRNLNKPAWMTQQILQAIRRKKRLWKRARVGDSVEEYKAEEKKVKNMIRTAKRKFERKLADGSKNDGVTKRKFYAYLKQRTMTRPSVGPLKKADGQLAKDDGEMATIFNRYFCSVFTQENTDEIPEPSTAHEGEKIQDILITEKKVKEKIRRLRRGAAGGPDKIGPQLLLELAGEVAKPLAMVMRRSLNEGKVPQDWKTANVSPIFKKGTKSSPSNYRPVSLTSVCCKLMESIVKDEVVRHLERHKLIKPSQHGFMRGKSCTSNLLSFLEKMTAAVDRGEPVDVVFLDFAKAFDKVPTERLIKKVRAHGISGRVLNWISAWLRGRKQRVVLNGNASDWAAVLSGVPQGSVLGPLLFIIFINDLDDSATADMLHKFADDTKVAQPVRTAEDRERLQESLKGLENWAATWGMEFNVAKCKVMHVGHNNIQHVYQMKGTDLAVTKEERDIGVTMLNNLKPTAQCAKAARAATTVLGQLSRAFHFRDRHVFPQLYKQYVRPHLEFAVPAWSPWAEGDKEALEKVQRRAVKMVSGLTGSDYEGRLRELEMTTLEERRHQMDMAQMFKIIKGHDDVDRSEWFDMAATAPRATRAAADPLNVRLNHGRLDIRKNFFSVRVTEAWNRVPNEIKMQKTVSGFKKNYAVHRLNTPN